jgi:hypothetical protein
MAILRMNKAAYAIGDAPVYTITGAQPGAAIAWTSFKDGQPTGELNAQYNQHTDANGNWTSGPSNPWTASAAGQWQKQVLLVNPDGSFDQAQATFTVGSVSQASGAGDFFSGSTNIPGLGAVSNIQLAVGGLVLLLLLTGGRRR